MRLRIFGALVLSLAVASGLGPLTSAQAATAPHDSTPGTAPTEFYFASGEGDYIGGGTTVDYTDPTVSVSASLNLVTASVGGWTLDLAAPSGQQLAPGTYTGATRYPFNTGTAPGITVSGDGRGCNNDYGTFTIYEISATSVNATFSQTCESTTAPPLVGFIRYNATTTTPVPTLTSTAAPITDPANSGTTSANADEFSFLSATGDFIGGGEPADYVGASNVSVSGTLGAATVTAGPWNLNLAAPAGQQLVPGTYTGATRYPFNTGTAPGLTVSGDSRGCDDDYGTFTIYEISADSTGTLTSLNATFEQTCETTTSPPLAGFVRYNATVPTPVPTLPGPLTASLRASTGAATANGDTTVTLDASSTLGTDAGSTYSFSFGDGTAALTSSTAVVSRPESEGTYEVDVTVTDSGGQTSTAAPQWITVGDGYQPVNPTRLLDTRHGIGASGPVAANTSVTLQLPSSVTDSGHGPVRAVVLNVTATQPTASGFVRVYPSGLAKAPTTSNLNYVKGETVANLVTVPVTSTGQIVLYVNQASGTAQLIADLEGYYTAGNDATDSGYAPLSPTRILDTRSGVGGAGGRVAGWGHVKLSVPSSVPSNATALVINVTAVAPAASGDVVVYPDGQSTPTASNLNFAAGQTVPNLVIVPIPADGVIDFYLQSSGSADLLADLEGYYSTSATARFVPSYPTRILDTRTGVIGGPLQAGWAVTTSMAYGLQVPVSTLTAALYNVTVTAPQGAGYITVFPDGLSEPPNVSNVNFVKNQTVANAALTSMSDGKQVFFNGGTASTQLIVDFFGYFGQPLATTAPPTSAAAAKSNAKARPLR